MAYTDIDNPELYFQTVTYAGNSSSPRTITLDGSEDMQPDWVWIKKRDGADHNQVYDSVRGFGAGKDICSGQTFQEGSSSNNSTAYGYVSAVTSDGFTLTEGNSGTSSIRSLLVNHSGKNFVAWNWKAGGSASSNSDGTETSNVSANTTAGFSIITYSGTTALDTYGHGLSQKPEMMIFKTRAGANRNWVVYHKDIGATKHLHLNLTDTVATDQYMFNNTEPTNSVITLYDEGEVNKSGSTYVGYIFHSVQGYSKFGKYTGNANADGTFVYTGFRPAFVLVRDPNNAENWLMYDNKRPGFNVTNNHMMANSTTTETASTANTMDFLSNGFKIRSTNNGLNRSSATFLYMAFAESPFVNSSGIPCNAR